MENMDLPILPIPFITLMESTARLTPRIPPTILTRREAPELLFRVEVAGWAFLLPGGDESITRSPGFFC